MLCLYPTVVTFTGEHTGGEVQTSVVSTKPTTSLGSLSTSSTCRRRALSCLEHTPSFCNTIQPSSHPPENRQTEKPKHPSYPSRPRLPSNHHPLPRLRPVTHFAFTNHLLDLDVSNGQTMPPRNYPPPLTGHDLMRLFPPQLPEQPLFLKQGSTSSYFRRQENQSFAQAGKEIIRVRVDSDFHPSGGSRTTKGKEPTSAVPHAWPAHAHPPPPLTMQPPPEHVHSLPHPVPPYPHHVAALCHSFRIHQSFAFLRLPPSM